KLRPQPALRAAGGAGLRRRRFRGRVSLGGGFLRAAGRCFGLRSVQTQTRPSRVGCDACLQRYGRLSQVGSRTAEADRAPELPVDFVGGTSAPMPLPAEAIGTEVPPTESNRTQNP